MPDKFHGVSQVIKDSATVLAIVVNELGFGDKTNDIIDRGKELLDTTMTKNTAEALGDDLDAYSVAVGFAAALGAFASCLGEADGAVKLKTKSSTQEIIQQMRKAKNN